MDEIKKEINDHGIETFLTQLKELRNDVAHMQRLSILFNYPIKLYRPPFVDLTLLAILWFIIKGKKIVMWSSYPVSNVVDTLF